MIGIPTNLIKRRKHLTTIYLREWNGHVDIVDYNNGVSEKRKLKEEEKRVYYTLTDKI